MHKEIEKIKEDLYVVRGIFGWRIVYPIKKDLNKPFVKDNIHWKNLLIGNFGGFVWLLVILLLVAFGSWAYQHDIEECIEVVNNIPEICEDYNTNRKIPFPNNLPSFDVDLNFTGEN